ncbi:MAG: peptidylprolyl isomerase [Candidatus Aminicenantes bacterium]|nr:peptidylprolyl isomerase [Candidatus Aminicenantes bacterium]
MKKEKVRIFLLVAVLVFVYGGCKDEPAEQRKSPEQTGKEKEQLQDNVDSKIILIIDSSRFSNRDLKNYIQVNYPGTAGMQKNLRFMSRIFDSFVENEIILSSAYLEDIPVPRDEYAGYMGRLGIKDGNADKTAIMKSIRLQKYLYARVYKDIDVSAEEIRRYYNDNHGEFTKKKEVLLYQILLKDKEEALNIRSVLKNNPQDFEKLAGTHSKSSEAKNGGLLGYFEEGVLPKEMEDVVFSLKINEISPVIESPYGFHIFKVTKQKRDGRLLYIKNVEAEIKNKLLSWKLNRAYRDYLEKLKKELQIDIRYNQLYFKYQDIKGDNEDETKQKITADSRDNGSSR